ncbi:MAG: MFS transporter [Chlamydiales bacterium]|nr:MFS transporter [Chlamydiales bacterium]
MSIRKYFTSFAALNLTQFFAAVNDNVYRLLLIFFVIAIVGEEHSNMILALAGGIFVIPFILFAPVVGYLADRYSKRTIIYITRVLEILSMGSAIPVFALNSVVGSYIILFFMALSSAIFSPCKYGIIPEIVATERISRSNGILTATTYLAIIFGTFFASFIADILHRNFIIAVTFCLGIAVVGALFSLGIEKTKPQASRKKFSLRLFSVILHTLKKARRRRYLFLVLLFSAYFLFIGSYTQLNIIPFTIQSLNLSEIAGGYLFLITSIGIGIGAFLVGSYSAAEIELGFVPLAALGVAFCFAGLFFFDTHFFMVVLFLALIGLFGGIYAVPLDTFVQVASPHGDRGQNIAACNFLGFIGVLISSGMIAFFGTLLNLRAATGFFLIGIITLILGISLLLLFADQVLRLFVATGARFFWHIRVVGRKRLKPFRPTLLVAPRSSWLDTLIVMATLPRLIRYIVPIENGKKRRSMFYRFLRLIPLDIEHFSPIGDPTLKVIRQELRAGHSVCLMHPVDIPSKNLKEWEEELESVLKDIKVPVMPIHISRKEPKKKGVLNAIKSLTKEKTKISYGNTKG